MVPILAVLLFLSLMLNLILWVRSMELQNVAEFLQSLLDEYDDAPPGGIQVRVENGGNGGGMACSRVVEGEDAWLAPLLSDTTQPNLAKKD